MGGPTQQTDFAGDRNRERFAGSVCVADRHAGIWVLGAGQSPTGANRACWVKLHVPAGPPTGGPANRSAIGFPASRLGRPIERPPLCGLRAVLRGQFVFVSFVANVFLGASE